MINQWAIMEKQISVFLIALAVVTALPYEPIIRKLSTGLRYQYVRDSDGLPHLVDLWGTVRDVSQIVTTYNPDTDNVYHLFTRRNPSKSQVLVPGNASTVSSSNFDPSLTTAILIHGWLGGATANYNALLTPALLAAKDQNVIVVDWCAGACTINYLAATRNTISSGQAVARFITWLNSVTGADPRAYHAIGFSLGGQQVGALGRSLGGVMDYITCLDPSAPGFENSDDRFRPTDGNYTEVIHTNTGLAGVLEPLGDVDFYPNGGNNMPGCSSGGCDHERAYFYLAESIHTGGFIGRRCKDFEAALVGDCHLPDTLPMGGVKPKFGAEGVFYVRTNDAPPFSLD